MIAMFEEWREEGRQRGRLRSQAEGRAIGETECIAGNFAAIYAEDFAKDFNEYFSEEFARIIEESVARGRALGAAETLLDLARHKFGDVPKERREQVFAASLNQHKLWKDRILDVPNLDDVFEEDDEDEDITAEEFHEAMSSDKSKLPVHFSALHPFGRSYIVQGYAEALLHMAERKFGVLTDDYVNQFRFATLYELKVYANRMLDAASLEAVFDGYTFYGFDDDDEPDE